MSGISFFVLLFVSLFYIFYGAISALFPKAAIVWNRRLYHKLRLIPEDKLEAPIKGRRIVFERVLGCVFFVLGILLINYSRALLSLCTGSDLSLSSATQMDATDFRSAVKALVAAEGP